MQFVKNKSTKYYVFNNQSQLSKNNNADELSGGTCLSVRGRNCKLNNVEG